MSTIRLPPYRVVTSTAQAGSARTSPMMTRILAAFCPMQGVQSGVGIFRRDHGEKLALIGNMQRVQPQQFARAANFIAHGNFLFRIARSQARSRGQVH